MSTRERPAWYAVRRFRSGRVLGSRLMNDGDASLEVMSWRRDVGPAARVPATMATRKAVRQEDQAELWRLLLEHEPRV